MLLTNENVYYYLAERNLVDKELAVNGQYMVLPANTRNNILKIILSNGPSLFIKQSAADATAAGILKREASAYSLLNENKIFSSFSERLPAMLLYDKERNVLVTELIPHSKSLHEYYMTQQEFPVSLAEEQAAVLSAYHIALSPETNTASFPKLLPWVLQLNDHGAYKLFPNNPENGKLIAMIQEHAILKEHLLKLKSEWQQTHFIHGDIKWVNFLVTDKDDDKGLKLIDWELADIGDPLWDVAGLLQSYLAAWVFSFDNHNPHNNALNEKMKAFSLENMQSAIQAMIAKYLQLKGLTGEARKTTLLKIMQYTAARIIQTSIEGVVYTPQIYANNMRSIQLACNIFNDPQLSIEELLGIKC